MNKYEIMFIIATALEDEKKDATIEFVKEVISSDGVVSKVDILGKRRLAYPIQKKDDGFYVVIEFEASTELPKELDRRLKISEDVVRHLIINKNEK